MRQSLSVPLDTIVCDEEVVRHSDKTVEDSATDGVVVHNWHNNELRNILLFIQVLKVYVVLVSAVMAKVKRGTRARV